MGKRDKKGETKDKEGTRNKKGASNQYTNLNSAGFYYEEKKIRK